ncbi:PAS domain-containing sensor histidine kinase [Sulfurimonas marina]|uniref:histidine kinase n=1 Tax=Sulfurimonas marina TaxID=2590551 RepID=A0A7M1AW12_9BACT|nr:PAS domain-containing sensor histidine kinase [Sulfurimonas marina]QOP41637.1 PAS domain S-box protein [Sulfurimonas marina]
MKKNINKREHVHNQIKKHSTELLELLTLHLPDMLWIKEKNGKYIYANKAICDGLLMAESTDEVVGKDDVFFALREREKHKENPQWHTFGELCFNSDVTVIENNKPMRFEEYGNVKGKMLYLEVFKAPFYDRHGNIIGTVGAGRDITELKNTQKSLEENLQLLEQQRKELELFNEKLEEKVKYEVEKQQSQEKMMLHQSRQAAMGEMLESIAHQWRQPLNIMGLAIANIETQLAVSDIDKDELSKKLEAIAYNISYLSDTIDDFRNFLNPAADDYEVFFTPNKSILEILRILEAQLKNCKIKIETSFTEEEFYFKGVENEFKQILFILINNSIDAIKKLIADKTINEGLITIALEDKENHGIVKVMDNGGGVDKEIQEKIFEPYFTTKHKSSGTGIGLYIAKNIIETRMHGNINFFPVEGGSCFSIELPIHKV